MWPGTGWINSRSAAASFCSPAIRRCRISAHDAGRCLVDSWFQSLIRRRSCESTHDGLRRLVKTSDQDRVHLHNATSQPADVSSSMNRAAEHSPSFHSVPARQPVIGLILNFQQRTHRLYTTVQIERLRILRKMISFGSFCRSPRNETHASFQGSSPGTHCTGGSRLMYSAAKSECPNHAIRGLNLGTCNPFTTSSRKKRRKPLDLTRNIKRKDGSEDPS